MTLFRAGRHRSAATLTILLSTGLAALSAVPAGAQPGRLTLTAEARRAGIEPGNAFMGWRESSQLVEQRASVGPNAAAPFAKKAFTPNGVLGMDVASYQRKVKWAKWAAKGKQFAYVKATEGTSYKNPYFAAQYAGSADAGLLRGAYHFASPNGASGKAQAAYFVNHGGGWTRDGRTLPGVLDVEYNPYGATCYHLSKKKMVKWISAFVTEYKRLTTRDAVIYSTADWWRRCTGNTTKFTLTNPLWVARYSSAVGTLPGAWRYYTFWQYTSSPLDQDVFSASYKRLKVLANG